MKKILISAVLLFVTVVVFSQDNESGSVFADFPWCYVYYGVGILLGLLALFSGLFTVKHQEVAVVQRLGKFNSLRHAGLQWKIPFIDQVFDRVSLLIHQHDTVVETKTKDDVFVRLKVSVQFQVPSDDESIYNSVYKLNDVKEQVNAYVYNVVRAEVPKQTLDQLFLHKDDIALALQKEIGEAMKGYGHSIVKALVTDIDPAEEVKKAMNHINAAQRTKSAAEFEAETEKIRIIAKANAEAESKRLQGKGIADQRREIAKGLKEGVDILKDTGINGNEASAMILLTQHYDTLAQIGGSNRSSLILMPSTPSGASSVMTEMIAALKTTELESALGKGSESEDN